MHSWVAAVILLVFVLFMQYGRRSFIAYRIENSSLVVREFGFAVYRLPFDDIVDVRVDVWPTASYLFGHGQYATRMWCDKVVITRRGALIDTLAITPDKPEELADMLRTEKARASTERCIN